MPDGSDGRDDVFMGEDDSFGCSGCRKLSVTRISEKPAPRLDRHSLDPLVYIKQYVSPDPAFSPIQTSPPCSLFSLPNLSTSSIETTFNPFPPSPLALLNSSSHPLSISPSKMINSKSLISGKTLINVGTR